MLHSLESRNIHKLLPIPIGACRLEHRKIELSSLRPSGLKYTRLRLVKLLIFSLKVVVLPPHFGKSSWKWNAHCQLDFAGRNERRIVHLYVFITHKFWHIRRWRTDCRKGAFIGDLPQSPAVANDRPRNILGGKTKWKTKNYLRF